jgi:predicted dehydrogenase
MANETTLRVGVLGAGPIAQSTHFESCVKARNAELYAICDVAEDLCTRMAITHGAKKTYFDYDKMLADPELDAVIIATSDAFHVEAAKRALQAKKHVLCEKPLGVTVDEVESLRKPLAESACVFQVGHMLRFDMGIQAAKEFVDTKMGAMTAFKGWYCDNTHRYTNTDAVQPALVKSALARKPGRDPKADMRQYLMLAHGSHLADLARFLCGDILSVQTHYAERAGMRCWFVDVDFASGALGHFDMTFQIRMDWHEGFLIYGENGSVQAKTYNPWFYRSSEVDIFHEDRATSERVLGADGHFYRRQLEGFADVIVKGAPMTGASLEDGIASIRCIAAINESAQTGKPVRLSEATGGP